eukprot:14668231-Ditylum_brightwellii.AAC.1
MYHIFLASGTGNEDLNKDELRKQDYDKDLDEAGIRTLNQAQQRLAANNHMKKNCRIESACAAAAVLEEGDGNNVSGDNNAESAIGTTYVLERETTLKRQEQEETVSASSRAMTSSSGKKRSIQCPLILKHLLSLSITTVALWFPDCTTPVGQLIDSYLQSGADAGNHAVHLLFTANWQEVALMLAQTLADERGRRGYFVNELVQGSGF